LFFNTLLKQNIAHKHNMLKDFIDINQYVVYNFSKMQVTALT